MIMIERVARAIFNKDYEKPYNYYVTSKLIFGIEGVTWDKAKELNSVDIVFEPYIDQAKAAIAAMRYLVKCCPDGNAADDRIVNEYIDAALKEE